MRVLAVDDADLIIALQRSFLRRSGSELLVAGEAAEAVERAGRERPDLVVLDATHDEGGALSACRRLKADPRLRRIPVVVAGGDAARGLGAGADGVSPVAAEPLASALRQATGSRGRRGERRAAAFKVRWSCGSAGGDARTKDAGPGGLFLRTTAPLEPGQRVALRLEIPGREATVLRLRGVVLRRVAPDPDSHLVPGVALRLIHPSARGRALLAGDRGGGELA